MKIIVFAIKASVYESVHSYNLFFTSMHMLSLVCTRLLVPRIVNDSGMAAHVSCGFQCSGLKIAPHFWNIIVIIYRQYIIGL